MENTLNTTPSRRSRTLSRLRRLVREIDYLERRKLELRTGVPLTGRQDWR